MLISEQKEAASRADGHAGSHELIKAGNVIGKYKIKRHWFQFFRIIHAYFLSHKTTPLFKACTPPPQGDPKGLRVFTSDCLVFGPPQGEMTCSAIGLMRKGTTFLRKVPMAFARGYTTKNDD